ncbi:MAG: DUF3817 domain-containing protein [Verrucomicrobiae bacterium]|nr:DUF3817 domain-containing protein [Verrucomicrobiae bacterium]NNJ44280.1 DUF3817 domain-containing protein [Akkermansiaceae bacterium]
MLSTAINRLRVISLIEALSYLILLGIAMPLKYIGGEPLAVRIVGMAHGVLFCLFCCALLHAMLVQKWSLKPPFWIFAASLVPFAPLWVERWLKKQSPAPSTPNQPAA